MNYLLALIALFIPVASRAEDVLKSPNNLAIGTMIASLLLVIACIFIFAFLMKKSNLLRNNRGTHLIKIISTQPLTNKGRVQVVEVNDKRYLLGVTEQNINVLDILPIPEEEVEPPQENTHATFSTLLSKISAKRNE